MFTLLAVTLVTSFLLGMRHATDPDHVVAVATIVSQRRSARSAAAVGALWGLGHTLTILLVGGAIIVWKLAVPTRVALAMEFAVAVMLVGLGAFNMARGLSDDGGGDGTGGARGSTTLPPLLVGTVHGLAGSAAATLLALSLFPDPRWAAGALVVFCLGTVLGMALVTSAIAVPTMRIGARAHGGSRAVRFASGLVSTAFGLYLVHRIGFVDGLFTTHAWWWPQ